MRLVSQDKKGRGRIGRELSRYNENGWTRKIETGTETEKYKNIVKPRKEERIGGKG